MTDDTLPSAAALASDPVSAPAAEVADPDVAEVAADPASVPTPRDGGDVELLALIDRLANLLDRSDLSEIEVRSGGTGLILRKPSAIVTAMVLGAPGSGSVDASGSEPTPVNVRGGATSAGAGPVAERPSVKAPLTGIFYGSPAPGSAPYVVVGGELAVGQVIGLIEAMKLFNEIKSDLAGRVVRIVPESGTLVKAKQPLIEVEPL